MTESETLARIQLALGARPDCRVLRLNVGTARHPATGQIVKFGVPGMADLLVMISRRPSPATFAWIEVKSETGTLRPVQRIFQTMIHTLFGPRHYVVARSVADAVEAVEELT